MRLLFWPCWPARGCSGRLFSLSSVISSVLGRRFRAVLPFGRPMAVLLVFAAGLALVVFFVAFIDAASTATFFFDLFLADFFLLPPAAFLISLFWLCKTEPMSDKYECAQQCK